MFNRPIFFQPNRVWRAYTGGALLEGFAGGAAGQDGHFPEDWLASTVRAVNPGHSQGPDEGLARTLTADGGPGPLLAELLAEHGRAVLGPLHAARYGADLALLCKYLDSSVRLPVQCHPDVAAARRLYGSQFGKTESWHVLDVRRIEGQEPYLLMGFKRGVSRQAFADAVAAQDIPALVGMLHRIAVRPGETYLVPGRLPHAIGPGVFMVETQEPTDLCIQPERYCADIELTDAVMWGGLSVDQGLDVFDYAGRTEAELLTQLRGKDNILRSEPGGTIAEVIGQSQTEAFSFCQARIHGTMAVQLPREFGIIIVTGGSGTMSWPGGGRAIRRGEYFLQPFGVRSIEYSAGEELVLAICLPPRP